MNQNESKSKTADNIEIDAQKQRFFNVLREVKEELEILAKVPSILDSDKISVLGKFLLPNEIRYLKYLCVKYAEDKPPTDFMNVDARIAYLLKIIRENYPLLKYLQNCKSKEPTVKYLTKFVTDIEEVFQLKLALTGIEERESQKKLRATYHANEFYKESISSFNNQMEKTKEELGSILDRETAVLDSYKKEIEIVKEMTRKEMEEKLETTLKIMSDSTNISEEKQELLKVDAENVKATFESSLITHIEIEKKLRAKRSKVEAQLASWIAKFDQDIGEKNTEYEELSNQYEELNSQFTEIQHLLEDQAPIFEDIMEEKEIEQEKIQNEVAIVFLLNRSARRIQRYWRQYDQVKRKKTKKAPVYS